MATSNGDLDALLAQVPVGELAAKFGVDDATVESAVRQALPGLLGGMALNASDEAGAAKLAGAAQKHTPAAGKLSLEAIDTTDGEKIVKHVLGDQHDAVAKHLGAQSGSSTIADLIPSLLPMLAPIVMQFLGGKLGGAASSSSSSAASDGVGGVVGDLLGGLLSGGSGANSSSASSGGGLEDLLGGLLGGGSGSKKQSGGGLGDLLGGLFGK